MRRRMVVIALVVLAICAGCTMQPKGIELGLVSSRLTMDVLEANREYVTDVRDANATFIAAKRTARATELKADMAAQSSPLTIDDKTYAVVSTVMAQEFIDALLVTVDITDAEKEANDRTYRAMDDMIDAAMKAQSDWARYLVETARWNDQQRAIFESIIGAWLDRK